MIYIDIQHRQSRKKERFDCNCNFIIYKMNNNYNNLSIINTFGNNNKRKVYTLHLVIIINNIISKVFLYTIDCVHVYLRIVLKINIFKIKVQVTA